MNNSVMEGQQIKEARNGIGSIFKFKGGLKRVRASLKMEERTKCDPSF